MLEEDELNGIVFKSGNTAYTVRCPGDIDSTKVDLIYNDGKSEMRSWVPIETAKSYLSPGGMYYKDIVKPAASDGGYPIY